MTNTHEYVHYTNSDVGMQNLRLNEGAGHASEDEHWLGAVRQHDKDARAVPEGLRLCGPGASERMHQNSL